MRDAVVVPWRLTARGSAALAVCMRTGLMERTPALPLARVLLGALTEAGMATADEADSARDAALWMLGRLRHERHPGI